MIRARALFERFFIVYATVSSAFYELFMVLLLMLIFEAISIEFRSKEPMEWLTNYGILICVINIYSLAISLYIVTTYTTFIFGTFREKVQLDETNY